MSGGTGLNLFKAEHDQINNAVAAIEEETGGFKDIAINAQSIARDVSAASVELLAQNRFSDATSADRHDPAKAGDTAAALWKAIEAHVETLAIYAGEISAVVQGTAKKGSVFPSKKGLEKIVSKHGGASTPEYAQTIKAIMGTDQTVFDIASIGNGSLVDRLILRHSVAELAEGSSVVANRKPELPYSYYNGDSVLDKDSSWTSTCDGNYYVATTNSDVQGWGGSKKITMKMAGGAVLGASAPPTMVDPTSADAAKVVKIPDISWFYVAGNLSGKGYPSAWRASVGWLNPLAPGQWNDDGTSYTTTLENVVARYRKWMSGWDKDWLHKAGCDRKDRATAGVKCYIEQPYGYTDAEHKFFYEWHKEVFGFHTSGLVGLGKATDGPYEYTQGFAPWEFIKDMAGSSVWSKGQTPPSWQQYVEHTHPTIGPGMTYEVAAVNFGGGVQFQNFYYNMEIRLREAWAAHVAGGGATHTMAEGRLTTVKTLVDNWGANFNSDPAVKNWGPGPGSSKYYADPRQDGAIDHQEFYGHSNSPFTELLIKGNLWNGTTLGGLLTNWAIEFADYQIDITYTSATQQKLATEVRYSSDNPMVFGTPNSKLLVQNPGYYLSQMWKKPWWKEKFYPAYWGLIKQFKKLRQEVYKLYKLNADMVAAMLLLKIATETEGAAAGLNDKEKIALAEAEKIIKALEKGDFTVGSTGFNKRMKFKEQCYLLANIFSFAEDSSARKRQWPCEGVNQAPGSLLIKLDSGQSFGFLNKLVANASEDAYYEMTPADLSTLQPRIQLYKIVGGAPDKPEYEVPLRFETTTALPSDILTARKTRGVGCGIKSFNFTYDGSNPFAAKKSIKAQLKIHAANFQELVKPRTRYIRSVAHHGTATYSYIDLALKTGGTTDKDKKKCNIKKIENTNLAKLNFRLKAVVGWASPRANKDTYLSSKAKRLAIDDSYVTLNLTPTVHDFAFNDDGSVVMTINYLAYVDDYFDQNSFNIFANHDIFMASTIRELALRTAKENCDTKSENYKEKLGEEIARQKQESIQWVVLRLMENNLVKYAEYGYDKIRTFMSKGPFAEGASGKVPAVRSQTSADAKRAANAKALKSKYISKSGLSSLTSDKKAQIAAALTVVDPNAVYIPFFYVGDLIDLLLLDLKTTLGKTIKNLRSQANQANKNKLVGKPYYADLHYKIDDCYANLKYEELSRQYLNLLRMRVVLGPVEIVNHASKSAQVAIQSKTVNFADLPISVKYFVEFLTEKMASKDRVVYPVGQFLNDFFNNLVRNFLNDDTCFLYPVKQKTIMNTSVLTAYRNNDGWLNQDPLTAIACKGKSTSKAPRVVDVAAVGSSLNLSGPSGPRTNGGLDREINMLVYSAGRSQPEELMNGDKGEDHARGVKHYQVGSRKGMIKDIKLSKTQTAGLAEVRFEQDGYDGLKQLRVIYDVEINSYAMPKAFPGTYIYVDPKGFHPGATTAAGDPMNLSEYGVGGYYMVYKSSHQFGPGIAESTLYAKWVAQLASAHSKQLEDQAVGDGEEHNPSCKG